MEYSYRAQTQNKQTIEGVIEAPDEDVAISILHSKGYVVLAFTALRKDVFSSDLGELLARPSVKDVIIFTRQLSTLTDASMPLGQSLRTLAQQAIKPTIQKIISNIADLVEGGSALSSALSTHPRYFTSFYINLIKSGETTGKLNETLQYLAEYMERSESINAKIRGALSYPAFVLFALIAVGTVMSVYVLPNLLDIFKESGLTNLPFTTRILIFTTDFINKYILYMLAVLATAVFFLSTHLRSLRGKIWLDNIKIKFPRFGMVVRNLYLARLAESLATLIKSQIPILEALHITSELVSNHNYKTILLAAEESVRGGGSISEIFARRKEIPPLMTSMIAIGEKTGKIDFMLEHVANFYKSQAENSISNITQIIEPVLILILGVAVAGLVSSILLPIYNLIGAAG